MEALFIFRRDLRIVDNTALAAAIRENKVVYPIFILDPRQIGMGNKYRSRPAIEFMLQSLRELSRELNGKLSIFRGLPRVIIAKILQKRPQIKAIYINLDYTPFAIKRDREYPIEIRGYHDALLNPPDKLKPYHVFAAYYRAAKKFKVPKPEGKISIDKLKLIGSNKIPNSPKVNFEISKFQPRDYKNKHDIPGDNATSQLSKFLKFGVISPREVYHKYSKYAEFIRQLYWRDFYTSLVYYYPDILEKGFTFYSKYYIKQKNSEWFKKWTKGETGFPIVDAGMRQLNQTGWMHNRVRLITASFLVKDLLQDWRDGERYFARNLVDYDPAVNNGNWQWVSGTGASNMPYFRVFNPWLQSKKYDKDGKYITSWIPELSNIPAVDLHRWDIAWKKYPNVKYPRPIINHDEQKKKYLRLIKFNH